MRDLSKQEAEERKVRQKEELWEVIGKLTLISQYAKQLKEEKESHEREIANPILEFVWKQEYKLLDDVIEILKMHRFML